MATVLVSPPSVDPYSRITEVGDEELERIAQRLELRAADEQQRAMRWEYLVRAQIPKGARVLEVGCGTGAVTRELVSWPSISEVIGCDPSEYLIERARFLAPNVAKLKFDVADGRDLPYPDESFDVVVFHTTLCHVPSPERALGEAFRVLKQPGRLAIFDGDYATTTVGLTADDPLQSCAQAAIAAIVHDPWLVRRLPLLVADAGFSGSVMRSHGYIAVEDPAYLMAVVDVGADSLSSRGIMAIKTTEALKREARARAEVGRFFGHIAYASLLACKTARPEVGPRSGGTA